MDGILETLSGLIQNNFWLAPVISLIAGLFTAFTPCSLSTIPLIIGYVGGIGTQDMKKSFRLSLTFALRNVNYFYCIRCNCCTCWKIYAGIWKLVVYFTRNFNGVNGTSNIRSFYIY